MTVKEKIVLTAQNNKLYCFKEGMFYKVYNQNAMWFVHHVKPYKVSVKFVKIVNQNVFTTGFPQHILNTKALHFNLKLEQDTITYLCYQTNHSLNGQEYVNCCNTTLTTQTRQQSRTTTQNRMQLLKHFDVAMQDQGRTNWYDADYFVNDPANHDVNGAEFKDWRFPTKREWGIIHLDYRFGDNGGNMNQVY